MGPLWRICMSMRSPSDSVSGMAMGPGPEDEADAGEKDRQRQHHAHGEPAKGKIADMGVGQAEEFDEDARQRIADAENAGGDARPAEHQLYMCEIADNQEQHDAFQKALVKLAGMAGQVA